MHGAAYGRPCVAPSVARPPRRGRGRLAFGGRLLIIDRLYLGYLHTYQFKKATVFYYVDLTGSFCCNLDLFGIATGWRPSQLKITKNTPDKPSYIGIKGKA